MHKIKKVLLDVVFSREDETYVAYSPALDLSTCGRTLEEAKKNFAEAANLFIEECRNMGTLSDVYSRSVDP